MTICGRGIPAIGPIGPPLTPRSQTPMGRHAHRHQAPSPGFDQPDMSISCRPLSRLEVLHPAVLAGDAAACEEAVGIVATRMRHFAHRMLRSFRSVRRWDDTDDIVQNAAIRFLRALQEVTPESASHLVNLATLQIRREIFDLARKHRGPESLASNHQSNSVLVEGDAVLHVEAAGDPHATAESIDRWTAFHEAASRLPPEERRIFELAWFLGADQAEVARHIGCSVRTVKRRWEEIKVFLRDACGDELPVRE